MIGNNYSIGITTFSERLNDVCKLVSQIRQYTSVDILLGINGNYKQDFNENYRKSILELSLDFSKVYPIFFPTQRGLAKIWNTLIIHSKTDWILVLNDDLEIISAEFFKVLENNLSNQSPDACRINSSFSHYIIHKHTINSVGWFDERLLGFGEEDGDFVFRYIQKYGRNICDWYIPGIVNLVSSVRDENIRPGISKYSAFNREFIFWNKQPKYRLSNSDHGIEGMFGSKHIKAIEDKDQYPYETFFWKNRYKI